MAPFATMRCDHSRPGLGATSRREGWDAMTDLEISMACWDYDRMVALQDGSVRPEAVSRVIFVPLMMPEPGFRMLRHREFDVAEMSMSWYARTVSQDSRPF